MRPYIRKFIEQEDEEESKYDPEVTKILKYLRDTNFGNESSRKDLLDKLTSLHAKSDPRARKSFKHIGDLFSEIGDELIKIAKEKEEE